MKLTRRKLAAAALAPAARALAQGQPAPSNPDEELKAARDRAKAVSDALAKQNLPMPTEPAFQFKA